MTPQDLEDEELLAYAEECAVLADFEDLEDVDWSLSDLEDDPDEPDKKSDRTLIPAGDGMDMS